MGAISIGNFADDQYIRRFSSTQMPHHTAKGEKVGEVMLSQDGLDSLRGSFSDPNQEPADIAQTICATACWQAVVEVMFAYGNETGVRSMLLDQLEDPCPLAIQHCFSADYEEIKGSSAH